jgi:hypothetical protein
MKNIIGKAIAATVIAIVLLIVPSPALGQATTSTTVTTISVADNPPAPDVLAAAEACIGEPLTLVNGTIHIVTHQTDNGSGGMNMTMIFTTQDVFAVGQITGTVYRGPGEFMTKLNTSGPPPLEFSSLFRIPFIGTGGANSFVLDDLFHITIDANGDITALVNSSSVVCR